MPATAADTSALEAWTGFKPNTPVKDGVSRFVTWIGSSTTYEVHHHPLCDLAMGLILPSLDDCTVAVIGLGYVGLPLAVEFAKPQSCVRTGKSLRRRVIGFDINQKRLEELCNGHDSTKETTSDQLQAASLLDFTSNVADLAAADVFVITVPTPIDSAKRPNLKPLEKASITVGQALKARVDYQSSNQKPPAFRW